MQPRRIVSLVVAALLGVACSGPAENPASDSVSLAGGNDLTTMGTQPADYATTLPIGADRAMVGTRAAHTATTLSNGAVFVAGGCVVDGCGVATADTFLVASEGASAQPGPAMSSPRDSHTANLISDGRVVLAGGFAGEGQRPLTSIDIFDPVTLIITRGSELFLGRGGHASAVLGDGRVLITGGWISPRTYTATTEFFDPATGTVTGGPDLSVAADALDAITLADGRVLVTGGQISSGVATSAAAIFDPATNTWASTGSMLTARFKHASVLLGDGTVLIIGGTPDDQRLLATTEVFDPATGTFSLGPDLAEPRYKMQGGAVVIDGDRVVIAGGGRTVEVLDIGSGVSTTIETFLQRGSFASLNILGSGDLLVLGGYDDRIDLRRDFRLIAASDI